jgi:hypothetical protein
MLDLLEKCPDLKLDIVKEKRSNNTKKSNDNKGKRGKQKVHPKSQIR